MKAVDKEFDEFIEFPTDKKSHVTTTSAIFFAEHWAQKQNAKLKEEIKKIKHAPPDISQKQLIGEMKERNEYRALLEECLFSLNSIKDQRIGGMTTYSLASKIEKSFRKFDAC